MSFTFKLAQRLARLMVLGVALLVACHLPDRTGPTPPDQPVRIVVSPASAALDPYQTQQFRAYGRSAAGDSVPVSVSYTATGGAITVSGLYTAGLVPGNWRVIAIQSGGLLADTAAITVTAPAPGASQFGHVFIVTEENTDYVDVIGSSSMPYLNGLAQQYGLATQYYANTHPSIGNYFELSTGQIISNNDGFSTVQNVERRTQLARGREDVEVVCGEHSERVLPRRRYRELRPEAQHLPAALGRGERPGAGV